MTNHEKLKRICDEIGYKSKYEYVIDEDGDEGYSRGFINDYEYPIIDVDEREIIFTQEFYDKYWKYIYIKDLDSGYFEFCGGLLQNLTNPTDYLYNLLFNK